MNKPHKRMTIEQTKIEDATYDRVKHEAKLDMLWMDTAFTWSVH